MHGILKANAPRGRGKKEDDMQPPSTLLLSTGEFARMCNVSKELLIHYDKVGLLKPKVIGKNGYRYYSLKQLYLMDAIRFFLDTGMSMKEVKTYLDNRTTDLFLEATQAGIEKMKKQRDVLDARIGMIEKMRYITQRALLFPKDKPRLSFWDETWLITTDVKPERTQQAFAQAVSEHAEFCKSSAGVTKFPLGRIVHFPCSDHPEDFVYTKLITWISPPSHPALLEGRLACKPRGNYAVILHRGGTSTVARSYAKLLDYVKEEGLDLVGPVYEFDMNSYLMSDFADDYLLHISVLVDM